MSFLPGLAALLLPCALFGADQLTKQTLQTEGRTHTYYVFAPESATAKAPLLVLLHGSGHDGRSLIDPWRVLAAKEGIVLVAPNSVDPSQWQAPLDGPAALVTIVDAVREKHAIDGTRIYLFGHSGGAGFALLLALGKPGYFAAIAVHASALHPKAEGLVQQVTVKTPIQVQVGTQDPFFPLAAVRHTRDLFVAAGFEFELKEIPGHDHDYYGISEQVNRDAWAFLKGRVLAQ